MVVFLEQTLYVIGYCGDDHHDDYPQHYWPDDVVEGAETTEDTCQGGGTTWRMYCSGHHHRDYGQGYGDRTCNPLHIRQDA